ncbi:MAG: uracil-DNA glycosylase [Deltaproteobacteria bacterium]|nr:uracil-DNA glycosylase [Deltaproteobacteria bacterium]
MGTEDQLEDLNKEIRKCIKCSLAETRINAICGEGNPHAKLLLIAQAPGKNEDKEGRMFIGPSGKVLDNLLKRSEIDRKEIYMTNLVKCMLPKYRRPKSGEIKICSEYLDWEIELINPLMLVSLGYYASRYIFYKYDLPLPYKKEFGGVYGKVFDADNKKLIPLQHPAAVLYNRSLEESIARNYQKMQVLFVSFFGKDGCM